MASNATLPPHQDWAPWAWNPMVDKHLISHGLHQGLTKVCGWKAAWTQVGSDQMCIFTTYIYTYIYTCMYIYIHIYISWDYLRHILRIWMRTSPKNTFLEAFVSPEETIWLQSPRGNPAWSRGTALELCSTVPVSALHWSAVMTETIWARNFFWSQRPFLVFWCILMYLARQLLPNDQKIWVSRVSEFLEPTLCFNLPQNSHLVWTILAIFHIVLRITHGHGEPTTMSLSRKTTLIQTKFNTYRTNHHINQHIIV